MLQFFIGMQRISYQLLCIIIFYKNYVILLLGLTTKLQIKLKCFLMHKKIKCFDLAYPRSHERSSTKA